MRRQAVAFLLDWRPSVWDTRCDFHLRLCRALRDRGAATLLSFAGDIPSEIRDCFLAGGALVHPINYKAGRHSYYSQLGELIVKHSITTVHVRFFDYFSLIPWLARFHGVRHILYTEANSGEWRPTLLTRGLVRLRARIACFPVTRLIAISEFIKRRFIDLGFDEHCVNVVYNGVDVNRFHPDPQARTNLSLSYSVRPDELIVATAMNLLPWKQPQVLVEACGLLASRGAAVRLFIAGDGVLRGDLESLSHKLGIADRIHWLGQIAAVEKILQACDVFVLTSVGEAFGNVLAEAMACGAPVIASRSGAIGEIVDHGRTGLLVAPRDPSAVADAIETLRADTELRREMAVRGRERAVNKFSIEMSVQETLKVYEEVWGKY